MTIAFEPADAQRDRDLLLDLNIRYLEWIAENVQRDSGPFMTSAHRLYQAEGFRDCEAYEGAEVPEHLRHNRRFMESLRSPGNRAG